MARCRERELLWVGNTGEARFVVEAVVGRSVRVTVGDRWQAAERSERTSQWSGAAGGRQSPEAVYASSTVHQPVPSFSTEV